MATEFTEDSVKEFLLRKGGKVKNNELVIHFKNFLNDSARKDEMREKFKNYVNTLATIKLDENKEKILVLKKKYMQDSSRDSDEMLPQDTFLRAKSEPPSSVDRPDGGVQSSLVRSENVRSTSDLWAGSDSYSLASTVSSSSLSSGGQELEEDVNASIMSVKERAQHLNRMESETELRKISSTTNLAATGKKGYKKGRDLDGDDSSTSSMYSGGYMPLSPKEKEWLVKCSKSDYHLMNELLSKNPELAKVRDFTSDIGIWDKDILTALHWACLHGKADVIKLLMGKHGVNVNQRSGYTPLHIAAQQNHEDVVELLIGFKADPNIRDYSGKKPKQYLRNSAASRTQQLLVSSRLGSKTNTEKEESGVFLRNTTNRRSNRDSAIRSLIRASSGAVQRTVMGVGENFLRNSSEDVNSDGNTPKSSPRNSAEPSPSMHRKHASGNYGDSDLMPPPSAPSRNKVRKPVHSVSKESLVSDNRISVARQVSRSESEPNLGEVVQPSKTTFI